MTEQTFYRWKQKGKAKDQFQLVTNVFDGATCFRKFMGPHGLAEARASGLERTNAGFDVDFASAVS